jgi:hypothetical protein
VNGAKRTCPAGYVNDDSGMAWATQKHNISRIEPDGRSHIELRNFGGRIRENISKRSGRVKPFPSQSSDYEIGLLATEITPHACCPVARLQNHHCPRSRQPEVNIVRVVYKCTKSCRLCTFSNVIVARTQNKNTRTHAHTHARTNTHTHTHIHAHTLVYTHERINIRIFLYSYVNTVVENTRNFLKVLPATVDTPLSILFNNYIHTIYGVTPMRMQ